MKLAALLCVALLAACGSADDPPPPPPPSPQPATRLIPPIICVDTSSGHKVTYYCEEPR